MDNGEVIAMRVMVLIKATRKSETGEMPGEELLTEMGQYNEKLMKAESLLAGDDLKPNSFGKQVRFSGGSKKVIDGPFPETKKIISGYWI